MFTTNSFNNCNSFALSQKIPLFGEIFDGVLTVFWWYYFQDKNYGHLFLAAPFSSSKLLVDFSLNVSFTASKHFTELLKYSCFFFMFEKTNCGTQPAFTCLKLTIEILEQRCEICSKLAIKTSKRRQWGCFSVFIVNFEDISSLCSSVFIVNFKHIIAGWEAIWL